MKCSFHQLTYCGLKLFIHKIQTDRQHYDTYVSYHSPKYLFNIKKMMKYSQTNTRIFKGPRILDSHPYPWIFIMNSMC